MKILKGWLVYTEIKGAHIFLKVHVVCLSRPYLGANLNSVFSVFWSSVMSKL